MITRALESKEKRKDAKRTKKEKEGLNVAALEIGCCSIREGEKMAVAQCRSIGKNSKTQKLAEWWLSQH